MEASSSSILASINKWFTPAVLFIFLNLMIATILFTSNLPNNNNKKKQQQPPQSDHIQPPISQSILHRLKSQISKPKQDLQLPLENAHPNNIPPHLEPEPTQVDLYPTHLRDLPPPNNIPHLEPTQVDLDPTHLDELPPPNIQTHFVLDNHTVEKVTTHYVFDPTPIENENKNTNEEENHEVQNTDRQVNRTKSDTNPASGEIPVKLPAKMKKSASLKSAFSHFEEENIVEARRPATVREQKSVTEEDDVEVDAKADDFINKFRQQLKLQRLDSIVRYKDMINRGNRV